MDLERLYLDYNATSPLSQSVQNWLKSGDLHFANPASQHSSGKASRKIINEIRVKLYETFGKSENDFRLFFHSGATEGILTFAHSFSEHVRKQGKELLICYAKTDHPAVTSLTERYYGPHVTFFELSVDKNLQYEHQKNLKFIQQRKNQNQDLIILYHHLWVHNETGIVSPLEELQVFKNIPDLYLHIDSVQAPGKIENWKELSVGDIFTFSAHKFGAFKGLGYSFYQKDMPYYPFISGGGQQGGLRSGTENPLSVQSLGLALSDLEKTEIKKTRKLKEELEVFLSQELEGIGGVISDKAPLRNSNTIYFYLTNLTSDVALALFDLNGLMISAGSACSSGAARESVVMTHLGFTKEARNGLRISLNFSLSDLELAEIKRRIQNTVQKVKSSF